MNWYPGASKALRVFVGFQSEIRAYVPPSEQCNLSAMSWWLRYSKPPCSGRRSWPTADEFHALAQRLRARLASRSNGHKRREKKLSEGQVRVLLRDMLLVAWGLRPSCLVDCCALTKERVQLLLDYLDRETHDSSRVCAVLLDGNVFFVNVETFVAHKMSSGLEQQMYVDVSASLTRPKLLSNSARRQTTAECNCIGWYLALFSAWTVTACKILLSSRSRVLEWNRPAPLNATALAGILLCYPCVYDIYEDHDVAGDEWSEQVNCLSMCPLLLLQTSAVVYVSYCNISLHSSYSDLVVLCRPQQQLELMLHEFSVPQHLLHTFKDEETGVDALHATILRFQFNAGEFTVAWLTFKGDAIEDEEQHYVAKKDGLLSSKLLRGLFGDTTMRCFEEVPGDTIPKEAFVCILALFYEGNTEDRISYIFTMYNIIFFGENNNAEGFIAEKDYLNNAEGFIAEKDYLYLLNYLEEYMPLPKQLYAAFEECMIPMAGQLSNSQFVTWVRKYPDVMEFLAIHLPPSPLPGRDPLNNSPSCRNDSNRNPFSSFDFIGGEDSGDEDSDGMYDSDHLTEVEMSQSSYRDSSSSMNGNDELTSILKEAGRVMHDENTERTSDLSQMALPRRGQERSRGSRSRGVQKMGRYMGKAVGGGISKVGHVGRSILHVGKSQGYNQHAGDHHSDDPAAVELLSAGYSFSSESQSTKKYVCGYLHKISDSKWGKKRSWHRRWFVLDRQRGVLSYYRHNPANHMPTSSSSHGNIVHMADSPVPTGKEQDQVQEQQQTLLYLNEAHPWYRGALDLNMDNVSLLFEKTLARNAPTRYFFQVSTLSLHDIDSKRGVQYKLCADMETDFDLWTSAIAEAINRKDSHNGMANNGAPVLSHQQLYRQRLVQKQMEEENARARESEGAQEATTNNGHDSPPPTLGPSPPKRKIPPRIVTQFSSGPDSGLPDASCWHLHIHVDGTKQCLIVGFMLNIVAIRCLDSEHVLWKVFVCIVVTCMFVVNIYNPESLHRPRHGSVGGSFLDVNGSIDNALLAFKDDDTGRDIRNSQLRLQEVTKERALFEFIAADLVRTDSKMDLISQRVEFPPEHENSRLFIINAQLPSYGPSVWGDGSYDGPGYSLALYWKIPDEIFEELKNPTTTTLKLLKRFLEAGDDTSLTDRFKVIAQVTNQDECGITGMAKKLLVSHNATPVLTRPQHRIYHFKDGSTEVVVDIHAFSYIARRGIHSLLDKTSRLVIDVAFVVQGETDEELPEQVLGCCRLDRVDVNKSKYITTV
ncbi:putative mitochondrial protein [Phytophthora megakarya]|uniref:Putative mitochondrial protein n=1 Tax=Phytophthora megakarya TaxID=4795 RepID=A0A225W6J9_9STRA|nr:putative mitochondrial protein [Phytophthora megakarya]